MVMDRNFKPGFRIDRILRTWRMRWILLTASARNCAHSCGYGDDAGTACRWFRNGDHSALACYYEKLAKVEVTRYDVVPGWRIAIRAWNPGRIRKRPPASCGNRHRYENRNRPSSYKESLSASEVAQAIEKGFRKFFLMHSTFLFRLPTVAKEGGSDDCSHPGFRTSRLGYRALGEKVNASWGISGDGKTAFMKWRRPVGWSWYLRKNAIHSDHFTRHRRVNPAGAGERRDNIIIGIGGSATNDGGAGMVQGWGRNYATPTAMKLVLAAVV